MKERQQLALLLLNIYEDYEMDDNDKSKLTAVVKANEEMFRQQVDGLRGQQLNHLAGCLNDMVDDLCKK